MEYSRKKSTNLEDSTGDGLTCQRLDRDWHATTQTENGKKSGNPFNGCNQAMFSGPPV